MGGVSGADGTAGGGARRPRRPGRRVVLDATVVVGVLDPSDALHRPSTEAVEAARSSGADLVLPATVLAEVLVGIARTDAGALDLRRRQLVAAFGEPHPVDADVAAAAAARCGRMRALRLADALVLGVADVVGAEGILTLDRRWAVMDERVAVVTQGA